MVVRVPTAAYETVARGRAADGLTNPTSTVACLVRSVDTASVRSSTASKSVRESAPSGGRCTKISTVAGMATMATQRGVDVQRATPRYARMPRPAHHGCARWPRSRLWHLVALGHVERSPMQGPRSHHCFLPTHWGCAGDFWGDVFSGVLVAGAAPTRPPGTKQPRAPLGWGVC